MSNSTTTTNVSIVTPAQLALCERVIDMTTGQAFYIVTSETDDTVEYTVKAIKVAGRYFVTCTCPAGLKGIACKHKRFAAASAQVEKTAVKVEAMGRESVPTTTFTTVDAVTMARVGRAKGQATTGRQVEQDAKHYNSGSTFRLMR